MKKDHFDKEPPFSDEEKRLYQAAYKKIQDDIDVSFYDPVKSFAEIEKKLGLRDSKKQNVKEGWIKRISEHLSVNFGISVGAQASSAAISVFAIGIIFGLYVNTGPSYKSQQGNGVTDALRAKQSTEGLQKVQFVKPDPIGFINLVVGSSLDAGAQVLVSKVGSSYLVRVAGLKAGNDKQAGLKAILTLPSSFEGDALLEITEGISR